MKTVVFDTETSGLIPELGQTVFASATVDAETGKVRFYDHRGGADDEKLLAELRSADRVIMHNAQFDIRQTCVSFNVPLSFWEGKDIVDTAIWARHVWPERANSFKDGFGLKSLTEALDARLLTYDDPVKWLRKNKKRLCEELGIETTRGRFDLLPPEILVPYVKADVIRTLALWNKIEKAASVMTDATHEQIRVDHGLILKTSQMSLRGVRLSEKNLDGARRALAHQLEEVEKKIPFDWRSRIALEDRFGSHLFDQKRFRTPKDEISYNKTAMQWLASKHVPYASLVLEARQYDKQIGTYLDSWNRFRGPGRIHCTFKIVGPRTGRMASGDPNLQNVPSDMKRAIVPDPGCVFVSCDWSQMELWAAAYLSNDEAMMEQVRAGSMHDATMRLVAQALGAEESKKLRGMAKAVNFGVLYGSGPGRLAAMFRGEGYQVSNPLIYKLLDMYWARFPGLASFVSQSTKLARKGVPATDPLGKQQFPDPKRAFALTNYRIQGFCAGIMKRALAQCFDAGLDVRLVVHDDIVVQCAKKDVAATASTLEEIMTQKWCGRYVFPAESEVHDANWKDKAPTKEWLLA